MKRREKAEAWAPEARREDTSARAGAPQGAGSSACVGQGVDRCRVVAAEQVDTEARA